MERRRTEAWRLRVYIDAIKDAEATSDEAWVDAWIQSGDLHAPFLSRDVWIETLRRWALAEAEKLAIPLAA